jgi:hypothetical protein
MPMNKAGQTVPFLPADFSFFLRMCLHLMCAEVSAGCSISANGSAQSLLGDFMEQKGRR